jgi:DNA polymerase-4
LFGSGEEIAQKIRQSVKDELGVTVSVGVSFNKVFAKLASELKKPDAVTVIPKDSFEKIVYPLPVGAMVSIGGATEDILQKYGIFTLGDLARADEDFLSKVLGKHGRQVSIYARGLDDTPVRPNAEQEDVKSIGNSTTLPINITDRDEIKRWFYVLAESVTARQRDADVGRANTVHVVVRHPDLSFKSFQTKVQPTSLCGDVAKAAFELFCKHCPAGTPVRLLGITISGFDNGVEQLLIGDLADEKSYHKRERAEDAVSKIRKKYGYATLQRGVVMQDEHLNGLDFRHDKQEPPKRGKLRRDEKKD